jgi:hypothetical protein
MVWRSDYTAELACLLDVDLSVIGFMAMCWDGFSVDATAADVEHAFWRSHRQGDLPLVMTMQPSRGVLQGAVASLHSAVCCCQQSCFWMLAFGAVMMDPDW